jgi:hypothetical protein
LLNYSKPFRHSIAIYPGFKKILNVELEGIEVKTQSFFSFNYDTDSQFKIQKTEANDRSDPFFTDLFGYEIYYSPEDTTIHYRTYKTFNSAFANCFAVFKLYTWLFGVLLNHYYEYNINNIIINKNFEYGRVIDKSSNGERKLIKQLIIELLKQEALFIKESLFYKISVINSRESCQWVLFIRRLVYVARYVAKRRIKRKCFMIMLCCLLRDS